MSCSNEEAIREIGCGKTNHKLQVYKFTDGR